MANTYNLNVRFGPGAGYSVMTILSQGQVINLSQRNANGSWVRVVLANGQQGGVNASYLSTGGLVVTKNKS